MTWLRRLGCVEIWLAVAVFVIGTAVSTSATGQALDNPPAKKHARSSDPNSSDYSPPSTEHRGGAQRDKLVAEIKEKLDAAEIRPPHSKKADDDFFVIGTIDLQDHHAIVDFVIKQGIQPAVDFVAEFVLGKERGMVREWRVFGRAKYAKAAEFLQTKAKADSIEGQLAAFKMSTPGKKSPDDYFVVGTADLNKSTLNANIRFEVLKGIKATADFLIDFIFNSPKNHKGEWHVFFRGRTEAQATDYRQQMRDWYDSMEAERAQLAAIYNARTTVRC